MFTQPVLRDLSDPQGEVLSKDLPIADLQDEIQDLRLQLQEQEEQQSKLLGAVEAKNRLLSEKVREIEKQSAILRSAILSGRLMLPCPSGSGEQHSAGSVAGEHNAPSHVSEEQNLEHFEDGFSASAVTSSKLGPDARTALLHSTLGAAHGYRRGFRRINPTRSGADNGQTDVLAADPLAGGLNRTSNARSRAGTRSADDATADLWHGGISQLRGASTLGAPPSSGRSTPTARAVQLISLHGRPAQVAEPHLPPVGKSGEQPCEWLETFEELLESSEREGAAVLSVQSEKKRRLRVRKEVERLLVGGTAGAGRPAPGGGSFHDTVDALDRRTRADCLDEVAQMLRLLGLLMRVMHSMQAITRAGLDMTQCCESIQVRRVVTGRAARGPRVRLARAPAGPRLT